MMRILRLALLGALAILLVALALANRGAVTLRLLPDEAGRFLGLGWSVDLPLFLVIALGVLVGLAIGFVWEWARESRHRSAASRNAREAARLRGEVSRMSGGNAQKDDVLALLEGGGRAR